MCVCVNMGECVCVCVHVCLCALFLSSCLRLRHLTLKLICKSVKNVMFVTIGLYLVVVSDWLFKVVKAAHW